MVVGAAQSDLAFELRKCGLQMPPKISWQFDNCGENKVCSIILNKLLISMLSKKNYILFRIKQCLGTQVHL